MKRSYCILPLLILTLVFGVHPSFADDRASSGLKEALNVGVKEVVKKTGLKDGYYSNPKIKIPIPEKLKKGDEIIRKLGGAKVSEELVKKMNSAAEKAAPEALTIFTDAIKSMTITDAKQILSGADNAATKYLEKNTSGGLKTAFKPIIKGTMEEVNAIKTYNRYMDKLSKNPLGKSLGVDIVDYVTSSSIDGLFKMIAVEEKKIRENPAARVTDLLKDVFGGIMKTGS